MENRDDKVLDSLVKKLTQEVGLEEPPKDFTLSVMDKVHGEAGKSKVFNYSPLIPRYVWWLSGAVVLVLLAYSLLQPTETSSFLSNFQDRDFLDSDTLVNTLGNLQLPDALVYGFLSLALFVLIQVFVLKTRWEKQYLMT